MAGDSDDFCAEFGLDIVSAIRMNVGEPIDDIERANKLRIDPAKKLVDLLMSIEQSNHRYRSAWLLFVGARNTLEDRFVVHRAVAHVNEEFDSALNFASREPVGWLDPSAGMVRKCCPKERRRVGRPMSVVARFKEPLPKAEALAGDHLACRWAPFEIVAELDPLPIEMVKVVSFENEPKTNILSQTQQ